MSLGSLVNLAIPLTTALRSPATLNMGCTSDIQWWLTQHLRARNRSQHQNRAHPQQWDRATHDIHHLPFSERRGEGNGRSRERGCGAVSSVSWKKKTFLIFLLKLCHYSERSSRASKREHGFKYCDPQHSPRGWRLGPCLQVCFNILSRNYFI